jgi:uncharacterized protein (PEP-CTERM system associated)
MPDRSPREREVGRSSAFDLPSEALASRTPERRAREREVERRLQRSGIPSDLGIASGFLTSRPFIEHTRRASVALIGIRNTITFTANTTKSTVLGPEGAIPDDFTLSPQIEQRSFGASWAYRISALSTLNFLASRTESEGVQSANLDTAQSLFRVLLTRQMTQRTSASVAIRYERFEGSSSIPSYTEKAITAALFTTF